MGVARRLRASSPGEFPCNSHKGFIRNPCLAKNESRRFLSGMFEISKCEIVGAPARRSKWFWAVRQSKIIRLNYNPKQDSQVLVPDSKC